MPQPTHQEQQVLAYLRSRGFNKAEQSLRDEITGGPTPSNVVNLAQLAHSERAPVVESPQVYTRAYDSLRSFVLGSLDIFRPELLPLLLPAFVHSCLDLVEAGHHDEASVFLDRFASDHESSHPSLVLLLRSARLKEHTAQSDELSRWRREKFLVRLTDRGWSILLGWLQSSSLRPLGDDASDDAGRDRILRLINEHVKITIVSALALASIPPGLESEIGGSSVDGSSGELKLGIPTLDPKLEKEVQRTIRDEEGTNDPQKSSTQDSGHAAMAVDGSSEQTTQPQKTPSSTSDAAEKQQQQQQQQPQQRIPHADAPTSSETLPYPPSFRIVDVRREVEQVREARKRIRLGRDAFTLDNGNAADDSAQLANSAPRESSKPSICLFTLHDTDGCLTSTSLSEDSTILAAGFSESYIRLWNVKGHSLRPVQSDFDPRSITDPAKLRKLKEKGGSSTRKLVGHSGPVYAISFDPIPGPASPPRYMLSSSQDGTVRLWSLDTYTTVAVYKGHRSPVWTVEWGPKGIYFATGSRDRTARIWTTESTSALRIFAGHLSDVDCVKFHPNSLYLATGSSDRTCRIWDIQKGTCVRVLTGHRGPITCLEFSPNGRFLASGSDDKHINLWDIGSGKLVRSLAGHSGRVESVAFGAESTILASGGDDCSVRIWDADVERMLGQANVRKEEESGRNKDENNRSLTEAVNSLGGLHRSTGTGLPDTVAEMQNGKKEEEGMAEGLSKEQLAVFYTKATSVIDIRFTRRNLCLAIGGGGQA